MKEVDAFANGGPPENEREQVDAFANGVPPFAHVGTAQAGAVPFSLTKYQQEKVSRLVRRTRGGPQPAGLRPTMVLARQ